MLIFDCLNYSKKKSHNFYLLFIDMIRRDMIQQELQEYEDTYLYKYTHCLCSTPSLPLTLTLSLPIYSCSHSNPTISGIVAV